MEVEEGLVALLKRREPHSFATEGQQAEVPLPVEGDLDDLPPVDVELGAVDDQLVERVQVFAADHSLDLPLRERLYPAFQLFTLLFFADIVLVVGRKVNLCLHGHLLFGPNLGHFRNY